MHQVMEDQRQQIIFSVVQTAASNIIFHGLDCFRIYTTLQFLTNRYADQAFNEIGRYKVKPAVDADHYAKTSAPIMLSSAAAAVILKMINALYQKKYDSYLAAQDYAYALFSSSILFFAGDLFSGSGYMPPLSAFQFMMISMVGVLAMMAIFFKLTTPFSSDKMIFAKNTETQLTYFDEYAKPFLNPSKTERLLNAVGSVGYIASLSTFFWVLNHEIHNGVSSLAQWQKVILGLGAGGLALFGSRAITDHPRYYLSFLMAVAFLNSSAIAYASVSTLACYVNCKNHNADFVVSTGVFFALLTGLFSATHIQYFSENTHVSNQRVEAMLWKISDKASALFNRCCRKPVVVEELQGDELLEIV